MNYKTDMHLHTYYSDGKFSPTEIVKRAKRLGFDVIAITDHDGTDGVKEAMIAGEAIEGIRVIPGIEISARENLAEASVSVHILGYNIDTENEELKRELSRLKQLREERNVKLLMVLKGLGASLSLEEIKSGKKDYVGKPDIARALFQKGYVKTPKDAFVPGHFLESTEAKAVKKEKLAAEKAISLIRSAGGIAVLAHPMKTKRLGLRGTEEFYKKLERIIESLKSYGLSGLECYHTEHTAEEALCLVDIAEKYHLHITEGSDFHGDDL